MNRKICRVFSLPSHTYVDKMSGTDYARVIQPMKYLDGYKDDDIEIKVLNYDHSKNKSFDWRDVFSKNDIIFFNYTTNDVGYAVMGLLAQKYKRKLIVDLDDDIFNIKQDNVAYNVFKKEGWGYSVVKAILKDVHHITVTNSHLKHSLQTSVDLPSDKITVLPNYVDLSLYKYRCKFKDRGIYRGLHFGSSTHSADLTNPMFVEGIDRIMKNYPNFTFMTIGAFIPEFRRRWGQRYEQGFGDVDLFKWIDKMPEFMDNADFMIVPLVNDIYTRSKSFIKFLEASSFKIPGVYQNMRQYQEVVDGKNGLLASTANEWYLSIKKMIDDKKFRYEAGIRAYQTAQSLTIQKNVYRYADMVKDVLDNRIK